MALAEIREFKLKVLDDIHELATGPVAVPEDLRAKVESFFELEEEADGKKTRTTTR